MGKSEKRWLVAAIVEFLLAAWFFFLVGYLYNSAANVPASANPSGEGDMVSAFLMLILFAFAAFLALAFFICLLVFTVKIFKSRKIQTQYADESLPK